MGDTLLSISVPSGSGPGDTLTVQAPDGRQLQIVIPPGVYAGMSLQVAVPAAAAAAEPPKKQATSLGGSLKTTAQRASAAHARNSSAFAAAPATAFGGGGGGGELYERATARSSWDPLASIRAKRGADVSNDPLGDLLAGDTFLIPPIYSGAPSYFLLQSQLARITRYGQGQRRVEAINKVFGLVVCEHVGRKRNRSQFRFSEL